MDFNKYKNTLPYPNQMRRPELPLSTAGAAAFREYANLLEAYEKYQEARKLTLGKNFNI